MKTNRILTLFAALMVSVLLTAQTNQQKQDVKKDSPVKVKLEMMKYAIFANPFVNLNIEDPDDAFDRCLRKQQIVTNTNKYPVLREYCYPIDRKKQRLNPDRAYQTLSPNRNDGDNR